MKDFRAGRRCGWEADWRLCNAVQGDAKDLIYLCWPLLTKRPTLPAKSTSDEHHGDELTPCFMLPPHHADTTQTAFQNPWPPLQSLTRSALTFFSLPFARINEREPNESDIPDTQVVNLLPCNASATEEGKSLHATWLGHAVSKTPAVSFLKSKNLLGFLVGIYLEIDRYPGRLRPHIRRSCLTIQTLWSEAEVAPSMLR